MYNKIIQIIRFLNLKEYKFKKNKKGELQIWVPISVKNRNELVNYLEGFKYNKNNTLEALQSILPEMVLDFCWDNGLFDQYINNEQDDEDDEDKKLFEESDDDEDSGESVSDIQDRLVTAIYDTFGFLNITMPLNQKSSLNHSGVLPNGSLLSETKLQDASDILLNASNKYSNIYNEIKESKEKESKEFDSTEDFLLDNFLYIDCPFCGMPHFFKNKSDIPKKDYRCECGNYLIEYTNIDENKYLAYDRPSFNLAIKNKKVKLT